jgi:hypothetical protein
VIDRDTSPQRKQGLPLLALRAPTEGNLMRRLIAAMLLLSPVLFFHAAFAGGKKKADEAKEALQALQDYIGVWKGSGASEKDKSSLWKETADWSWRFKGKDAWITVAFPQSRHLKNGEVRYLPDKRKYQLTAKDKDDKKLVFEGELKNARLILQRKDDDAGETQQVILNTAAGGIRFVLAYSTKAPNRTFFTKQYQVSFTKEGEAFAGGGGKKVECIVTGGLGTIPVSYMGTTYYVCCSGCRDAFNDDPAYYVKAFLKKKGS